MRNTNTGDSSFATKAEWFWGGEWGLFELRFQKKIASRFQFCFYCFIQARRLRSKVDTALQTFQVLQSFSANNLELFVPL